MDECSVPATERRGLKVVVLLLLLLVLLVVPPAAAAALVVLQEVGEVLAVVLFLVFFLNSEVGWYRETGM